MKILHVLASNRFSGAENVVCQIINMFKFESNMDMIYCSPDGQIKDALNERQINFVPVKKLSVKEIRRIIKDQEPDVIHAHDMRASFISARACGKIPLVSHIHNNAFDSRGVSLKSLAFYYAAKKAKHIFWVSWSAFEGYKFHSKLKDKSEVLHNVIDIDALYRKMEEDKNNYDYDVIYLGRLTYPKNPMRLLKIFSMLVKEKPDIKIAIVGTGELEKVVKIESENLNLINNVSFLGFKSNPLKILHDSKVMILTSRWEGIPMCALEAMAFGVPIVSTPVDGLKEIIINGENGYLSDMNEEISNEIIACLNDRQKLKRLSDNQVLNSKKWNNTEQYKRVLLKGYKF